jgi:hypothetical protein
MNPLILLVALVIGITSNWDDAAWFMAGYLVAFLVAGYMRGKRDF